MTTNMLYTIMSIQPKESSGGTGETRESVVTRQAKEMLGKLPKNYDAHEVKDRYVFNSRFVVDVRRNFERGYSTGERELPNLDTTFVVLKKL